MVPIDGTYTMSLRRRLRDHQAAAFAGAADARFATPLDEFMRRSASNSSSISGASAP
jgi:hypothetical protein